MVQQSVRPAASSSFRHFVALALHTSDTDNACRLSAVRVEEAAPTGIPGAHAVLRSGGELFLPLAGVVDVERERARVDAELERVEGLLAGSSRKLADPNFTGRAPPEVVEREEEKMRSLQARHELLVEKRASFASG